jgi:hypothetical protein
VSETGETRNAVPLPAGSLEPWPAPPPAEPGVDDAAARRIAELVWRYPTKRAARKPAHPNAQRRGGGGLPG